MLKSEPFWKPLPWQVEPWCDLSSVLLLTGSAGGGKSRLAAEKVHGFCKRYSGVTGLALRKTRESMTNSTVIFLDREVIGSDPSVRHFSSKNRFEYQNGSVLVYGGMKDDAQREQIRSVGQAGGVDIAWMEEANKFIEDDYNEVLARLRGTAAPWTQLILTTNPDAPTHWIKRILMDDGGAKVYYSSAIDNPHNAPEYRETLARLTGVLGERLRDGLWKQASGAVYESFDDRIHVLDHFQIPDDWQRFRTIDFGYTNPFVCQWWALDNDGRLWLYREIYMSQRTVRQHAIKINELSKGERIVTSIADHDAEDRATLRENGIGTRAATKDVSRGIQKVEERLQVAGDGKPRLFIMRGALVEADSRMVEQRKPISTLEEIPAYVWPKDVSGRPVKEQPVKADDHGMDAMRYMVMHFDGARRAWFG
jgi:phage terminase large subunit